VQNHFFEKLPGAELHNLYGPAETAVQVTTWHCRRGDERGIVPIGFPVANTQIYILDSHMQPVPVGIPGELYIGGIQVGRGYLNLPELTAERFIPNPFSAVPGSRLYRTGDLARYLPGGEIEYLGRTDHQVKIRGFRVELGEIEAALKEQEYVSQVVVMIREDVPGEKRLVAYLIPEKKHRINIRELRQHLKDKLPGYMIPNAFVILEKFPLNPNGKIDRRALPVPQDMRQTDAEYVAPRTELEKVVAKIWQKVLKLDKIGINDNFFDIGGHSILAIRIAAKAHEEGLQLRPYQIFTHPTIASLARIIRPLSAQEIAATRVELSQSAGNEPTATSRKGKYVASDFPEAGLDQAQLDRLIDSIGEQTVWSSGEKKS